MVAGKPGRTFTMGVVLNLAFFLFKEFSDETSALVRRRDR